MPATFSIYRSSAGSGKTRTLAKEYLRLALKSRAQYFRHILAVTFTNKASQEMKDRILFYLDEFANGRPNELAEELKRELRLDDQTFRQHSQETQAAVLHNYSQFSISTIDAFFQKVIRSFTRESGLMGDYRLEVDQDAVLEEVINNLIDELGSNKELTDWVVDFARENLENERAWDVRSSLLDFAREIFRDEFRDVEEEVNEMTAQKHFFRDLKTRLWETKTDFIQRLSKPASEAMQIIHANGWSGEDFHYGKNSGLLTFFRNFSTIKNLNDLAPPGKLVRNNFSDPKKWAGKNTRHATEIQRVATDKLAPILNQVLTDYDSGLTKAISAEVALKNLYVFGLIADISRKLKEFKDENNLMLLADAPKFLNGVIQSSDTPFIYEKVGSFYKNYLIDEFQDTSGMQWKNFHPLIVNSLDQGHTSLVVGDVKQAIYRWRGGDLNLLQSQISEIIGKDRTETIELDSNFRSFPEVVHFNNQLFKTAASIIARNTGAAIPENAFGDVAQKTVRTGKGFVRVELIGEKEETEPASLSETGNGAPAIHWKDVALRKLPLWLEKLQEQGAALKDIAILVRKNEEGQRIASYLLQHKNSSQARAGFRYDVVSNESLRIDGASTVNLLLGAMRYLLNADDSIARAQLGYEYARLHEAHRTLSEVFTVANQSIFENNLPPAFTREKIQLKKLSLLDLTETLIRIFDLGSVRGEIVYLQAFQDLILDFGNRERNDLGSFLEWWEDNKQKKSIQISGNVDAAQILTIHKSKGLQFQFVIIPFCSWPLDHENWQAPNLWVRSPGQPFPETGFIPIRYGSNLEKTCFSDAYREERTRSHLDNLNLLYVAFTRAIQGMIVSAPGPQIRNSKDSVAGLVYNSIVQAEHLKTGWDESLMIWSSGDWLLTQRDQKKDLPGISMEEYISSDWQEKIVISKTGTSYFGNNNHDERAGINYGLQIHAVLSKIRDASEIPDAIQQLVSDGLISAIERDEVEKEIQDLLQIPGVASWFSSGWEARTEVPILVPGGEQRRIDRLLISGRSVIIIDFKTGKVNKADQSQVKEYMDILREMNFADVRGFLVYLQGKNVLEIRSEGRQRFVKRTGNKDQLSLGF